MMITDEIYPVEQILWRRLDTPGHEACRLYTSGDGWSLRGSAIFLHEALPCCLHYDVLCGTDWTTRRATVEGWIQGTQVRVLIEAHDDGTWLLNGVPSDAVKNCTDIDLNFSPSTNLLPIRRLALAVGEQRGVRAAWLRFPDFVLEPLDQTYTRRAEHQYRYSSADGAFVVDLDVTPAGFVSRYGEFWEMEPVA